MAKSPNLRGGREVQRRLARRCGKPTELTDDGFGFLFF